MTNKFINLTEYEIGALKSNMNLADAHAHQSQSLYHKEVINRLPEIWFEAENNNQDYSEDLFLQAFFTTQNQKKALSLKRSMLFYSSSIAIMVVANFLKNKNLSISLIEPCFDNLPDLLKNQKVNLAAFSEEILYDNVYKNLQNHIKTDGIFLLDPVNPTGFSLSSNLKGLKELLSFCRDFNKVLVLDLCFAPFFNADKELGRIDLYELLEEYNVEYICIEDTGKFFATQDTKCSILTTSSNLFKDIYKIQTDVLLNVSPFTLNLLSKYIDVSAKNNYSYTKNLLRENMDFLINSFKKLPVKIHNSSVLTSVAWIELLDDSIDFNIFINKLRKESIFILPGEYFYWNTTKVSNSFFRIALARNVLYFKESINKICDQIRILYE